MAELSTLARPYARAAFEVAQGRGDLPGWSAQLATAAAVAGEQVVATALASPSATAEQKAGTLIELCGDALDDSGRNFIRVVAANKRLPLLGEIAALFERYKANQEKSVDVTVLTAFPLDKGAERNLAEVLGRKLEREVKVTSQVDKNLLGGVLVRAGDLVIDGSLRGRLNKLAEAMGA